MNNKDTQKRHEKGAGPLARMKVRLREVRRRRHFRKVVLYMKDVQMIFSGTWSKVLESKGTSLYRDMFGKMDDHSRAAIAAFLSNESLDQRQLDELSTVADRLFS